MVAALKIAVIVVRRAPNVHRIRAVTEGSGF